MNFFGGPIKVQLWTRMYLNADLKRGIGDTFHRSLKNVALQLILQVAQLTEEQMKYFKNEIAKQ